jgi:hypothetical protein
MLLLLFTALAEIVPDKCPSFRACIGGSGILVPGAARNDVRVCLTALLGPLPFRASICMLLLGYQIANICPSYARHEACYDRIGSDVLILLGILSQPSANAAEAKVGGSSLTPTRGSAASSLIINVHSIVATETGQTPLPGGLLVASLHDGLEGALLLPANLFSIDCFLLHLVNLRLEICKGGVAAL